MVSGGHRGRDEGNTREARSARTPHTFVRRVDPPGAAAGAYGARRASPSVLAKATALSTVHTELGSAPRIPAHFGVATTGGRELMGDVSSLTRASLAPPRSPPGSPSRIPLRSFIYG